MSVGQGRSATDRHDLQSFAQEFRQAEIVSVQRVMLGRVAIDLCSEEGALTLVRQALERSPGAPPLLVGSVNLDHIHHFGRRAAGMSRAIGRGDEWLMLVDGMPTLWAARRVTGVAHPRLAGSDLLPSMLRIAEASGKSVGFVGGTELTRERLAEVLAREHPLLRVVGHWIPERHVIVDREKSQDLAANVKDCGADLLVVGLGKPRQELWADEFSAATGARVVLAFGASADFLAGIVHRAPDKVRDSGFEWLYRLAKEPRRLARRYLMQGPVALKLLLSGEVIRGTAAIEDRSVVWMHPVAHPVAHPVETVTSAREATAQRMIILPDTDHAKALQAGIQFIGVTREE